MKIKKFFYLFSLACCFGPSYLFMKISVEELPPFTIVFLRVFIAACLLFFLIKVQKKSLWRYRKHLKHFFVMGAIGCVIPFALITYSERSISSGLAGLINGSVPLFAAILSHFYLPNDALNMQKSCGILIGLVGLTFVFLPGSSQDFCQIGSALMVVLSSLFYASAMVYAKKKLQNLPPLIAPTWQLIMAALIALPLCLFVEKPYHLPLPSLKAWGSVIALATIGSALAFVLYYRIIEIASASYLSFCTLLFPLIAVLIGAIFLGERLSWNVYVGGGAILSGLLVGTELLVWKKAT